jgi:signal transduction histidine kinase
MPRLDLNHTLTHLQKLNSELQKMVLPETALSRIAQGLGMALQAHAVGIYARLDDAGAEALVAEFVSNHSTAPAPAKSSLVLVYEGETVGCITLELLESSDAVARAEAQALLHAIAHHTSAALFALKQLHELRREREQLILAREEERRRLRRNLHDSVGPTLAALNLRSGAIRRLIQTQPETAEVQMGELREQIRSVITDIRRVIYDLRPPALDELGVLSAIREQARQMSLDGLEIDVNAPERLPPLSAAAEVNAYFIVCEALTNVLRHSRATQCWVRINVEEHDLVLEVCDNGVGLKPGHTAGVGLNSMRERATELGGHFELDLSPTQARGVCVRASLPLRLALRNS